MSTPRAPRRGLHEPSLRSLRIYRQLVHEGLRQTTVAKMYGISQGRISQTARRVRHWVDLVIGKSRTFRQRPDLRFFLALAQERLRLSQSCDPLMAMFDDRAGQERYVRRYIAVIDGQPTPTIEITDLPSPRLFGQAADLAARLAELESVSTNGPFADLTADQLRIITHRHVGEESDDASSLPPSRDNRSAFSASEAFYSQPPATTPLIASPEPARAPNTTPNRSATAQLNPSETLLSRGQALINSTPPMGQLTDLTPSPPSTSALTDAPFQPPKNPR